MCFVGSNSSVAIISISLSSTSGFEPGSGILTRLQGPRDAMVAKHERMALVMPECDARD